MQTPLMQRANTHRIRRGTLPRPRRSSYDLEDPFTIEELDASLVDLHSVRRTLLRARAHLRSSKNASSATPSPTTAVDLVAPPRRSPRISAGDQQLPSPRDLPPAWPAPRHLAEHVKIVSALLDTGHTYRVPERGLCLRITSAAAALQAVQDVTNKVVSAIMLPFSPKLLGRTDVRRRDITFKLKGCEYNANGMVILNPAKVRLEARNARGGVLDVCHLKGLDTDNKGRFVNLLIWAASVQHQHRRAQLRNELLLPPKPPRPNRSR